MLKSNFSHYIDVKADRENIISAPTNRAFCYRDHWDKAQNKTLSVFSAVTNVHCLFGFRACTSITAHKLQFMSSQDAILSVREQCCVLLIHHKLYILNYFFLFLHQIFFALFFNPRLSYFWSDNKTRSGDLEFLKPHTCLNAHTQANRPILQDK